jgi:ATP-dependent RNA helicase SUPV3L1/SUV3
VAERALEHRIPPAVLPAAVAAFRRTLLAGATAEAAALVLPRAARAAAASAASAGGPLPSPSSSALQRACERTFPLFAAFAAHRFGDALAGAAPLLAAADLSAALAGPAFPLARSLRRRLIYHAGPTNSGKTHAALEALRGAESGVYCGPLRLLAMEVYDACNAAGVYCSLRTGQEKRDVPFARHTSCTVEMADTGGEVLDVGVVDEIQLLADDSRGWAWTRALYGLPAREVHLCGDASALPLVRAAAAALGEALEERHYSRLTPLDVAPTSLLSDYSAIQPGDAVVAFSRRAIFDIKRQVELRTGRRCAVVYGALPPEARRRQAALFNDPDSGHDVLVASDAIGLGLNLNIRRVVFHALSRREGGAKAGGGAPPAPVPLAPPLVKQIAGRAGRAGSRWPRGEVAAFNAEDVPRLLECLAAPTAPATAAGVLPSWEHIAPFADAFPGESLPQLLRRYDGAARLGGAFFMCRRDDVARAAGLLERVPGLSLRDRFLFATAPVSLRDATAAAALLSYASAYAAGDAVPLGIPPLEEHEGQHGGSSDASSSSSLHRGRGSTRGGAFVSSTSSAAASAGVLARMAELETRHAALSLYQWLAQRMAPDAFPFVRDAEAQAAQIVLALDAGLMTSSDAALRAHARKARAAASTGSGSGATVSSGGGGGGGRGAPAWGAPAPRKRARGGARW